MLISGMLVTGVSVLNMPKKTKKNRAEAIKFPIVKGGVIYYAAQALVEIRTVVIDL